MRDIACASRDNAKVLVPGENEKVPSDGCGLVVASAGTLACILSSRVAIATARLETMQSPPVADRLDNRVSAYALTTRKTQVNFYHLLLQGLRLSSDTRASEVGSQPYGYTLGFAYCNLVDGFRVGVFPGFALHYRFSFSIEMFFLQWLKLRLSLQHGQAIVLVPEAYGSRRRMKI